MLVGPSFCLLSRCCFSWSNILVYSDCLFLWLFLFLKSCLCIRFYDHAGKFSLCSSLIMSSSFLVARFSFCGCYYMLPTFRQCFFFAFSVCWLLAACSNTVLVSFCFLVLAFDAPFFACFCGYFFLSVINVSLCFSDGAGGGAVFSLLPSAWKEMLFRVVNEFGLCRGFFIQFFGCSAVLILIVPVASFRSIFSVRTLGLVWYHAFDCFNVFLFFKPCFWLLFRSTLNLLSHIA